MGSYDSHTHEIIKAIPSYSLTVHTDIVVTPQWPQDFVAQKAFISIEDQAAECLYS